MYESELTPNFEEILRCTTVSDETPGLLLHDFQVMLDFVHEHSPTLTKSHLFSMNALKPLNEQLRRTIEHGLARPQQKSLPHINGLFLLLRASGLTLVDGTGRKPALTVDETALQSWNDLNADERYFALLESWLLRADASIIGERSGRHGLNMPLFQWAEFYRDIEQRPHLYADKWSERVRYRPGQYNLALMELFGLVEIEDDPSATKKGWQILDVRVTPWGNALLAAIWSKFVEDGDVWGALFSEDTSQAGHLQPMLQPYRPHWVQLLQLPGEAYQTGTFVFKVSLSNSTWRQIILQDSGTLEDLSDAILDAYDFDQDHLYLFRYSNRFGIQTEANHPYMDEEPFTDEVRIGDLPAQAGFHMIYNYDFGDNWRFHVVLERIDPPQEDADRYRISERRGKSPKQYPDWD